MRERKREERDTCKSAKPSYSVSARAGIGRKRKEIKWGLRHVDPLRLVSQHRRPRHTVCCDCRQPGVHRGRRSSDEVTISSCDTETRSAKLWPRLTSSTRSWHLPRQARTLVSSIWMTHHLQSFVATSWSFLLFRISFDIEVYRKIARWYDGSTLVRVGKISCFNCRSARILCYTMVNLRCAVVKLQCCIKNT